MSQQKIPISMRQANRMTIIEIFSTTSLLLPAVVTRISGQNGLVSLISGSIGGLLYALALIWILKQTDYDFIGYSKKSLGSFGAKGFAGIYYIRYAIRCGFAVQLFSRLISDNLLEGYSIGTVAIPILLLCGYLIFRGIEVRARTLEFLFVFVFAPLILVLVLALPQVNIMHTIPTAIYQKDIFEGGYAVLLCFSAVEFLLFSLPEVTGRENHKVTRNVLCSCLVVVALNVVIYVVTLGMFGVNGTENSLWPALKIMQTVRLPGGFIKRLDILLIAFWIFSMFGIISGYASYSTHYIKELVKKPIWWKGAAVLFLVAAYFLSTRIGDLDTAFTMFSRYMIFIDFPIGIGAPLLMIIVGKMRRK